MVLKKSNKRQLKRKKTRTNTKRRKLVQKGGVYTAAQIGEIKRLFGLTDDTIEAINGGDNSRTPGNDYLCRILTVEKLMQIGIEIIEGLTRSFDIMRQLTIKIDALVPEIRQLKIRGQQVLAESAEAERNNLKKERERIYEFCVIAINIIKQRYGEESGTVLSTEDAINVNIETEEAAELRQIILNEYLKVCFSNTPTILPEEFRLFASAIENPDGLSINEYYARLDESGLDVANDLRDA